MTALVHDLHVHPAPSKAERWGDGRRVWDAAAEAGVRTFVWKAHEEHTVERCAALPPGPVRALASASLNPWARFDDVVEAIEGGARWLWGCTMTAGVEIGWDLSLPEWWPELAKWLAGYPQPLILGTGHLGPEGRLAFAELARASAHTCSITHSLYIPLTEALAHAAAGCALEIDGYTFANPLPGRRRGSLTELVEQALEVDALVYFTSDGGQASTGNPFAFGRRVLEDFEAIVGPERTRRLAIDGPAAVLAAAGIQEDGR